MFNTVKYARKIRQYAKNEIYLQYKEKKPDKYFSKLGGKPLVPKDFVCLIIQEKTLMVL